MTTSAREPRGDGRRHRADGERSRRTILKAAAELATVEGLDGLSIGRLAEHVAMSKSGLYAHFGSKEELQLATVDMALEIFDREVIRPGMAHPEGVARVHGFCDAYLSYLDRRVFPGGCFFVSTAIELEAKEGPVKERVREVYGGILAGLTEMVRGARALGELDPGADIDQLAFELDALMMGATLAFGFFDDRSALDRARAAIGQRLGAERAGPATEP